MLSAAFRRQSLGEGDEVPKVRTRAEGAWYAGDDCDPRVWVGIEPSPGCRQFGKVNQIKRIPPLRTIDDNTNDVTVEFVVNGHPTSMQARKRLSLLALGEPLVFRLGASLRGSSVIHQLG